jgi:AcrR family transcriptional regulator
MQTGTHARPYHHGHLRAALLAAGERELAEKGLEGFALRGVAKRAGVSHAAPAHHFGDSEGLLSALAAEGFRRFLAAQLAREAVAGPEPRDRIVAAGLGYVDFALAHPALFRLMFSSARPNFGTEELRDAAGAAHRHLVEHAAALRGDGPAAAGDLADVTALWAMAHGLADLLQAGRILRGLAPAEREGVLRNALARALPSGA